jgi:hypothetical protein
MVPGGATMSVPRPDLIPGPVCALGAFNAISDADAAALVESSRARRRAERRSADEVEPAPQPAAPDAR